MNKNLLTRLGIAGLIIWILLQGGYSLYKNQQHNKVKVHLAKVVEYANSYMFPQALEELDILAQMPESTTEEKNLAELLKKMIIELQNAPDKTAILDSLNSIVTQSNILEKNLIESAKQQGGSGQLKNLEIRKQAILQELEKLSKLDTSKMTPSQRYEHEGKKLALLNELNTIMNKIQAGKPNSNNSVDTNSNNPDEQKKQEIISTLKKLNMTNEVKIPLNDRAAHRANKIKLLEDLQNLIENDNFSGTPDQEKRKKELLTQLKELHNKIESRFTNKKRKALKKQRADLLQELENLIQQEKPINTEPVNSNKIQQDLLAKQKQELESKNQQEKLAQQQAQLEVQKKQIEQDKQNILKQKAIEEQQKKLAQAEQQKQEQIAQQKAKIEKEKLEAQKKQLELEKQNLAKQKQIEDLKQKAKAAFVKEDYKTALDLYNQLETQDPNNAEIQAMKALILSRLKQSPAANTTLQKAKALSKGESIVDLAEAEIALNNNDTNKANMLYAQALKKGDSSLALYRLGNIELRKNNIPLSLDYYNRAMKSSDYDILENNARVKVYNNLGQAYIANKDSLNAQKSWKEAININPQYTPAYIALGQETYKQKDYKSASYYLQKAVEIDPNNFAALSILGNVLHMQKDNLGAKNALNKALTIQPNNPSILYNLGSEEVALQDYPNAIIHLQKALSLQNNSNTQIQLGLALVRSGKDIPKAKQLFSNALITAPNDSSAIKGLIEVLDAQKQYNEAIKYIEQTQKQNPKDTEIIYKKAEILYKMNLYPQAIQAFQDLIKIQDTPENHFQLANILINTNPTQALAEYNTLISKQEAPEFLEGRANTYIKINQLKEARTDLTTIITKYKKYPQLPRVNQKLTNINRLLPVGQ